MKSKKLLSLILAVIMIMSVVPMYASAAEKLTATANVESYPTLSYKTADGKMYYGQTLEEALIINDDEVVRDAAGNQVAGHFEFRKPEDIPTPGTDIKLDIIFVPDDEDAYTSFTKLRSSLVYTVEAVTLVPVDENDPVPVASEVEPGALLSTSVLSGGALTNPHNPNEPNLLDTKWIWSPSLNPASKTVVNASGYYTAQFAPAGYEVITEWVLVRVKGDTSEVKMSTIIEELPTVDGTVCVGDRWRDIKFTGGKAVGMNGEELSGTFLIDRDGTINSLNVGPNVKFIPDDERYATATTNITITVEPGPIKFVDENGNAIIPEITVPYGTKATDINLRKFATNCNETLRYDLSANDDVSLTIGTHTLEVLVATYQTVGVTPNYLDTVLTFKVVVEPVEFAVSSVSYAPSTEEINVKFNSNKFPGTFDVYVDGKLIGDDVPRAGDHIDVPYKLETSGKHTVKVVYNPIENDYYFMADYETEIQANVRRYITLKDMSDSQYINVNGKETLPSTAYILYGDEISIKYGFEDLFVAWVITDAEGKEIALDGVDLTSSEISFTMPDHDLVISVKTTLDEEEPDDGNDDGTDNGIFGSICSFLQKIISWFISIIKQMMSLLGLGA